MKFIFTVPNGANISYATVFILPDTPFDVNYSALVYFQLPNTTEFQLFGKINAEKPSAIFKIKSSPSLGTQQQDDDMMVDDDNDGVTELGADLIIGVSIELNAQADLLLAEAKAARETQLVVGKNRETKNNVDEKFQLANKIVTNAYNYIGGFADNDNKVSVKVLDGWWNNFKSKLQNDPNFLK